MKLYEFEGKSLFHRMGIPVPEGEVAWNPEQALSAAGRIGYPVVLKSQVLGGGRGKAGGIRFAETENELVDAAGRLFGRTITGKTVCRLLVEKRIAGAGELYMGIGLDPRASLPVLVVSAKGGVDIETVAAENPRAVHRIELDPTRTPRIYHAVDWVSLIGLKGAALTQAAGILLKLVHCYFRYEAITAEINPLIRTSSDAFIAADAKFEIDDSALFRLPEVKSFVRGQASADFLEAEARAAGVSYVRMHGGSIGLISDGAGLGMATMDMIWCHGGEPANFLDLGGDATPEKTVAALKVVLKTPGVQGVLLNVFGGINNCREMAEGICRVVDEMKPAQTLAVKMRGHSQEEGWALLEARHIPIVKYGTTEEAVTMMLNEMKRKGRA